MMPQTQLMNIVNKFTQYFDQKDQNDLHGNINEFHKYVQDIRPSVAKCTLPLLMTPYFIMHSKKDKYCALKEDTKLKLLKILMELLQKTHLDNENAFGLIFEFLLLHVYDVKTVGFAKETSEEVKQAVLDCFNLLFQTMSWDLYLPVYTQKHVGKFSLLLHLCVEITLNEKSKDLRYTAIECIMKAARIDDQSDLSDICLMSQISEIFIKFLPRIAARLVVLCVEDDKCGRKVTKAGVKAWGRLVSLLMRDYTNGLANDNYEWNQILNNQFESKKVLDEHSIADTKLASCSELLMKLTTNPHVAVRHELSETCKLLIETCFTTLPKTSSKVIELLIILSQDEDESIANQSMTVLNIVSTRIASTETKVRFITDNLQQSFHRHITQMPRVFNGLDEKEQITSLNLLNGYLTIFINSSKLKGLLFTQVGLNRLMGSLLHVAEVEKSGVSLLEEYSLHDWETTPDRRTPWKIFKFANDGIQEKLETTCHLLVQPLIIDIVLNYLLEVYLNEDEHKTEATILINEIISTKSKHVTKEKRKEILYCYLDPNHWELPLIVDENTTVKDVQNNIIQICLQLEGIGKIALAMATNFQYHLLKVLYAVLEHAGSGQPLLRAAGLTSTANISRACGYASITELINANADYFAFHVTNKLRRPEANASVLRVLAVVMHYSDMDVLRAISHIVDGVLLQSCDKYQLSNATSYLQVFAVFIKSMHRWLAINIVMERMHTKEEKEAILEAERLKHYEELKQADFSDDVLEGRTVEELYAEDHQSNANANQEDQEEEEISEYKKLDPPRHVKLVVDILERALNFLPAKNETQKMLALEILTLGVEVLRDYEDELLPIVHKIWSPLVARFKEFDAPLIVHFSFKLLMTLGRLSKDFIRMRAIKEALPTFSEILIQQGKGSYLKDRGAAYRYTQAYKMQLALLSHMGQLLYDLDISDEKIYIILPGVNVYLSSKQPLPLQEAAVGFYKTLLHFDSNAGKEAIEKVHEQYKNNTEWVKNCNFLLSIIT